MGVRDGVSVRVEYSARYGLEFSNYGQYLDSEHSGGLVLIPDRVISTKKLTLRFKTINMECKVGDKVRFMDDIGGGIIARFIDKKTVAVRDEDGFEIPVS